MDELALRSYFERTHGTRATLGRLDCVRFVVEAIYYGWQVDYREILGYQDRRSAIERLRLAGGLEQAFTDELGDPVDPEELEVGDIAFFPDSRVGLVLDGFVAVKYRATIVRAAREFASFGWKLWLQ